MRLKRILSKLQSPPRARELYNAAPEFGGGGGGKNAISEKHDIKFKVYIKHRSTVVRSLYLLHDIDDFSRLYSPAYYSIS